MLLPTWMDGLARDLAVVAGILTALEVIRRVAIKPVWRILQRIAVTIEAVHEQLVPNGGGSLRDAVDRLEDQHSQLSSRLDTVHRRLESLRKGDSDGGVSG